MTKQKKSFLEKLTGVQRIEEDDEQIDIEDESPDEESAFINRYQDDSDNDDDYEYPNYGAREKDELDYEEDVNKTTPVTEEASGRSAGDSRVDSEGQLTIDVYQTEDEIVIKSTIAGVKPEDLDVNINNDMVTVRGERVQSEEIDPEDYYYQECYWGPFSRSVILPVEIIPEKAEATMKNGILTVKLPKADVTKTRKIQVRGY